MPNQKAILALGLNNSESQSELIEAIESIILNFSDNEIVKRSSLYSTPAFPNGSGPDFVNAAIIIDTDLAPEELLSRLHKIEDLFQRERPYRWAPRSCDIDLIFYDQTIMPTMDEFNRYASFSVEQAMSNTPDRLILPHPRAHERAFVLGPIREIAPDFVHPVFNKTIEELWQFLSMAQRSEIMKIT